MKQNQNFNQLRNRLKKYNINWKMNQCMTVLIRIWPHRFLIFTLLYGTEGSNKDKVVGMRFIINIFCMHDYYWLKRKMPGEGRVLYPFTLVRKWYVQYCIFLALGRTLWAGRARPLCSSATRTFASDSSRTRQVYEWGTPCWCQTIL